MELYLIVARGKKRGTPIPIRVNQFVMGSDPVCQLRSTHPKMGGQHCGIVLRDGKAFVRDLNSGEPTLLNDRPIPPGEEWPLHKGEYLEVGPLLFRVSFSEKIYKKKDVEEWALKTLDADSGPKKSALEELAEVEGFDLGAGHTASDAASGLLKKISAQKGVVRGQLRVIRDGAVTVVRLESTMLVEGAELAMLKHDLRQNLESNNLRVLIDLKNVRRMSVAGATVMAELAEWLRGRGGRLALCRLRPELGSMVNDLSTVFNLRVFPDRNAAVAAQW